MPQFIDRRLNPRDKSLGNRQRFLRRSREEIKRAVDRAVNDRNITDAGNGGSISIPSRGISEPAFHHSRRHGRQEQIVPGNKEFIAGDRIAKPDGGAGGGGKEGSDSGEGEDDFIFSLSQAEFLDILFDDLELPDLIKSSLKDMQASEPRRAGYSNYGNTSNLNVLRTLRNSVGRRIALHRPAKSRLQPLEQELAELEANDDLDIAQCKRVLDLYEQIEGLNRQRRAIPFIDPIDIRYNRFEERPIPRTKAVMFCLMDVSGSMGEHEKELAKRFFILLHLFLQRQYERVDMVFIRHTHTAREVDEQEFFHSRESGGTVVSTALDAMLDVVKKRYPVADWNIYAAQASDGDNYSGDTQKCVSMLAGEVLSLCQYYAYVEILTPQEQARHGPAGPGKELWRGYQELDGEWPNFAIKHVASRSDIYPVFRELFSKRETSGPLS
jgi:hypothetical protein